MAAGPFNLKFPFLLRERKLHQFQGLTQRRENYEKDPSFQLYDRHGHHALLVCITGSALATSGKVTKELEYRNISVTLDGEKLDLRDAKGNAVEPFMFEGTNYLPVRALAESLGLSVSWGRCQCHRGPHLPSRKGGYLHYKNRV